MVGKWSVGGWPEACIQKTFSSLVSKPVLTCEFVSWDIMLMKVRGHPPFSPFVLYNVPFTCKFVSWDLLWLHKNFKAVPILIVDLGSSWYPLPNSCEQMPPKYIIRGYYLTNSYYHRWTMNESSDVNNERLWTVWNLNTAIHDSQLNLQKNFRQWWQFTLI